MGGWPREGGEDVVRWQGTARGAGWGKRNMPVCTRKKDKGEGRDISPLFYNQGV